MVRQPLGHFLVAHVVADDRFYGREDLGEGTTDPVIGRGRLLGKVIIEAAEHRQFADLLAGLHVWTQEVGQCAGGCGAEVSIPGIGFGFERSRLFEWCRR